MENLTLTQLQELHTETYAAYLAAVKRGQSYSIKDRAKVRVEADRLWDQLKEIDTMISRKKRGGGLSVTHAVPTI